MPRTELAAARVSGVGARDLRLLVCLVELPLLDQGRRLFERGQPRDVTLRLDRIRGEGVPTITARSSVALLLLASCSELEPEPQLCRPRGVALRIDSAKRR